MNKKKLTEYFTFTGSVHPNEIASFYRLSDVLITPRIEGTNTPLKIYAYLRAGKPIVATRHITHTQVLNDDVAVLTNISANAFAQGIIRILKDKKLGERLSCEAKKLAQVRYSKKHYVNQIKRLFYSIKEKRK